MILNNYFLKNHEQHINTLSELSEHYLGERLAIHSVPLSTSGESLIEWKRMKNISKISYHYEGDEEEVKEYLLNSELVKEETVIVDIGYDEPILEVDTLTFINYWYDFFAASGYVGMFVISKKGNYFIEFLTKPDYIVYSNFPITKK